MKAFTRAFRARMIVSVIFWLVSIASGVVCLVIATGAAKDSAMDATFPHTVLGLPILEGFKADGKFGVHLQWGVIVLLVVPLIMGTLLSMSS
ncbi:hypothetical protein [Rathayibacter toxicus]|uniref:Uncharacterized protein n=2 Tax=Rathayibacter toxicus TaxID=145458 RepID=A0A0U1PUM2_9MICO|nr:hypothetical protein [Rathayibacter toxicus]ALS56766.1 hypothetical protein APU90_02400 [Rathayibacter toxicus]KKM46387.1 hypothetical protein VT73_05105 [Rathayibacter toxicus]PPH59033.1 transcriptional regulator [Rathayibacter toxicus]PPH64832.1 transcriptional regulator [Rathayibacter toxicus]PPH69025.1 transcriptional regulator [Rathayibacter toxicus]